MENRVYGFQTPEARPGCAELQPSDATPGGLAAAAALCAFDFDGTLTVADTFIAFLLWRTRGLARVIALLRLAPAAFVYLWRRDRSRLKAAAVKAFLHGVCGDVLGREAEAFAAQTFDRLMRPDALTVWAERRAAGERLVIVTASPESVIAPFAQRLCADRLLGTRLHLDAQGRIDGDLDGPNCRGQEKVARLHAAFGPVRLVAAYGDTSGDRAMLAIADAPFMKVFKARP